MGALLAVLARFFVKKSSALPAIGIDETTIMDGQHLPEGEMWVPPRPRRSRDAGTRPDPANAKEPRRSFRLAEKARSPQRILSPDLTTGSMPYYLPAQVNNNSRQIIMDILVELVTATETPTPTT